MRDQHPLLCQPLSPLLLRLRTWASERLYGAVPECPGLNESLKKLKDALLGPVNLPRDVIRLWM
jgi:hypothetical protein